MKKVLCSFILVFSLSADAQNPVPNPGFEMWVDYGPYEDPQVWSSFNEFTWPFGGVTIKKDSGTHSGVLSVKLTTIGQNNTVIPGVLCTGALAFSDASCSGGFPVNMTYANFTGFYKYLPEPGDSCVMFAMLTKWNEAYGIRDTIALAAFLGSPASTYTLFSIPFHYQSAEVPDSGQIMMTSTKYLFNATPGSVLILDDLAFSGNVGVDEIASVPVKIFPDPADEYLKIQIPPSLHAQEMDVFDCMGRRVLRFQIKNSQESVSTKLFPEGIFFYKILSDERRVVASGKFMVAH